MKSRFLTALILGVPVLVLVASPLPFVVPALCATVWYLAASEVAHLAEIDLKGGYLYVFRYFPALALLSVATPNFEPQIPALALLISSIIGVLGTALVPSSLKPLRVAAMSLWVLAPLFALETISRVDPLSASWSMQKLLFLALVPQWAGDVAAIFVGSWLKGPKLAPALSPKKTWSGSIGNLLACILFAILISPKLGLFIGLGQGIFGQAGDLFESSLKRKAGVKDSGTLLPGHGGILDRIDSLLFSVPATLLAIFYLTYKA